MSLQFDRRFVEEIQQTNAIRKLNEISRDSRRRVNYLSEFSSFLFFEFMEKRARAVFKQIVQAMAVQNSVLKLCSANVLEGIRLTFTGGEEKPPGDPGGPGKPVCPGLPGSPLMPIPWSPWKQTTIYGWSQRSI